MQEVIPKTESGFNAFSFATCVFDFLKSPKRSNFLHHLRNASGIVYNSHTDVEFLQKKKEEKKEKKKRKKKKKKKKEKNGKKRRKTKRRGEKKREKKEG